MRTIVVVTGAGTIRGPLPHQVSAAAHVVAADGGLDVARRAGLSPTLVVGDLDSISNDGAAWVAEHGIDVEPHPQDKDATDTELALAAATRLAGCAADAELVVLAADDPGEHRLDHVLAVFAALGHPDLARFTSIKGIVAGSRVAVVHGGRHAALDAAPGTTVSLLALHGDAQGVCAFGCQWPLDQATLEAHRTRGVSNIATGLMQVSCERGVVTVVMP